MKPLLLPTLLLLAGAAGFPPGNVVTGPSRGLAATADVLVVDADGRPVPGATVAGPYGGTRTDSRGRASVRIMSGLGGTPAQDWRHKRVVVSARGYVPVVFKGGVTGTGLARLLRRGRVLAGRCVDSDGRPVSGLALALRHGRRRETDVRIEVDGSGRFSTDRAPPREAELRVVAGDRVALPLRVVPPDGDVELLTWRPARIRGRLRFAGDPDPHRLRHHWAPRVEPSAGVRVRGSRDGEFTIEAPPGAYVVSWCGTELGPVEVEEGEEVGGLVLDVPHPPPPRGPVVPGGPPAVVTPRPSSLPVRIVGTAGDDCRLAALVRGRGAVVLREYVEDAEEPRPIPVPPAPLAWLALVRHDRVTVKEGPFEGPVELDLSRTGTLGGKVVDARGRPVEDGSVRVRPAASRLAGPSDGLREFVESSDGEFAIDGVGPGVYDLVWCSPFLRQERVLARNVRMPDPPEARRAGTLVLRLRPEILRVAVIDRRGVPVGGAVVRVDAADPPVAVRTDRYGLAEIDLHDPTDLTVEASGAGGAFGRERLGTDHLPTLVVVRFAE